MEELELSEEERVIILFLRALKKHAGTTKKSAESENPNEVRITVNEDLNMGEKVG